MTTTQKCSLRKTTEIIQRCKEQGIKNKEIIQKLLKKGCCFTEVFDAMSLTEQGVIDGSTRR